MEINLTSSEPVQKNYLSIFIVLCTLKLRHILKTFQIEASFVSQSRHSQAVLYAFERMTEECDYVLITESSTKSLSQTAIPFPESKRLWTVSVASPGLVSWTKAKLIIRDSSEKIASPLPPLLLLGVSKNGSVSHLDSGMLRQISNVLWNTV